jgi:hypothetical protein
MVLVAASLAGAAGLSQPAFTPAGTQSPVWLVKEKRSSDNITNRVKRAWKDLVGYKFTVACPVFFPVVRRTCTETGNNEADARSKCISQNPFCFVSTAG